MIFSAVGARPGRYFQALWIRLIARCVYIALKCLHASWHIVVLNRNQLETLVQQIKSGEQAFIAVFWHGDYFALLSLLQGVPACVFVSDSFRGRVIRRICQYFQHPCEILPGQYQESQQAMQSALHEYGALALAADGPLGPYHSIKPNILKLAAARNTSLLPITVVSSLIYRSRSRWDKFGIPLPFSRVTIRIGPPVVIPAELRAHPGDKKKLQDLANHLRHTMETDTSQMQQALVRG